MFMNSTVIYRTLFPESPGCNQDGVQARPSPKTRECTLARSWQWCKTMKTTSPLSDSSLAQLFSLSNFVMFHPQIYWSRSAILDKGLLRYLQGAQPVDSANMFDVAKAFAQMVPCTRDSNFNTTYWEWALDTSFDKNCCSIVPACPMIQARRI